jgi:hypothetical protein
MFTYRSLLESKLKAYEQTVSGLYWVLLPTPGCEGIIVDLYQKYYKDSGDDFQIMLWRVPRVGIEVKITFARKSRCDAAQLAAFIRSKIDVEADAEDFTGKHYLTLGDNAILGEVIGGAFSAWLQSIERRGKQLAPGIYMNNDCSVDVFADEICVMLGLDLTDANVGRVKSLAAIITKSLFPATSVFTADTKGK